MGNPERENSDDTTPADRIRSSSWSQLVPGEQICARHVFDAIGGVRGLIESIVPGLAFLIVYTVTSELQPSVLAPVVIAALFIVIRLIRRENVSPAVSGALGIALSAGIALFSGRAEDNFITGFVINAMSVLVVAASIVIKRPLVGVIAGAVTSNSSWRTDPLKFRRALLASIGWVGVFGIRLLIELPLYFSSQTELLATAKLLLGLPLYALMLWITWILLKGVFVSAPSGEPHSGADETQ